MVNQNFYQFLKNVETQYFHRNLTMPGYCGRSETFKTQNIEHLPL